jgi:hypothetical protein
MAQSEILSLVAKFQSGTNRWVFEVLYEDASTGPPTIGSLVDAAQLAREAGLTRVQTRDGTARWMKGTTPLTLANTSRRTQGAPFEGRPES